MLPCACGQSARYAGRHGKNFESVLGPLRLERAYYHCDAVRSRFLSARPGAGLGGGLALSRRAAHGRAREGAMVSFEEGHELLHELARRVDVPTKHVERAAEATLGREVAEDEKLVVEPPEPNEPLAPTLYLGMDGTGVPVRKKELVGRPGKQTDDFFKDARGQARHDLERRGAGQRRHARARRRLPIMLLGCDRKRGAQRH